MKKFKRHSAKINILHFHILVRRYFRQIFTNVGTFLPLLLEAPLMILIVYIASDKDAFATKDITMASVNMFLLVIIASMMGILNSYREICKERDILSREVYGGLDVTAYALSKFVVLATIGAVQCLILFFGTLPFIDFQFANPARGYIYCALALILTNLAITAFGLFVSAVLKNSESAILPVLVILIVQVVFCDCLIALPDGTDFITFATPATWGIAVFGNQTQMNSWYEQYFTKQQYNLNPLIPIAILVGFTVLFVVLTIVKLKHSYKQKD